MVTARELRTAVEQSGVFLDNGSSGNVVGGTSAGSPQWAGLAGSIMALAIVGMPIDRLSHATIGAILAGGASAARGSLRS